MFIGNTHIILRILPSFNSLNRTFFGTNKIYGLFDLSVKDSFSSKEHAKILETLNESTPEDLSRYKISNAKIKGILEWKKKRGSFTTLSDVLEVEGFGEKILEDICKNIAYNNVSEVKFKPPKQNKNVKKLLVPDIGHYLFTSLQSAVAIHLDPTGVGWAKFERADNNLVEWKFQSFSSLPAKMTSSDTFNLALDIVRKTPSGDAYIFEAPPNLSPQSQTKQGIVSTHTQLVELLSMLLALLNTSVSHNPALQTVTKSEHHLQNVENRVFYLRSKVPARLFNTLIGYEKVSAISAITDVINKDAGEVKSLPCTPVEFHPNLIHSFLNQSSSSKELLAQALMLGVSFMDLCIRRNSECLAALKPNRNKTTAP